MPLDMQVGLGPGDFVSAGGPSSPENREQPHPIFGACLLWPNGCMDEDATWYWSRTRPMPHCVRRGLSSPRERGTVSSSSSSSSTSS